MASRHMACKTCRDRKVRCPGEQPTCEKCKRSGDTCIYVSPSKQSKADLAQTVEILQERLDKAEAQLKEVRVVFEPNGGLAALTSTDFNPQGPQGACFHDGSQIPSTPFSDGVGQIPDLTTMGTFLSPVSAFSPPPEILDSNAFLKSLPNSMLPTSPIVTRRPDDFPAQASPFPSLHDLRTLNSNQCQQLQQPPGSYAKKPSPLVQELAAFSSVILQAHADAAGMSSVLADYLRWAKSFAQPNQAMASILETLEARAREISALCSAKSGVSFERLQEALGNSDDARNLQAAESRIQEQISNTNEFFQSHYDIQAPLGAQRGGEQDDMFSLPI